MSKAALRRPVLALIALLVLSLACSLSATPPPAAPERLPATAPAGAATVAPFSGTPVAADAVIAPGANRFAPYPRSVQTLPDTPVQPGPAEGDVEKVEGLDVLDSSQQEQLFEVGFIVQPGRFNSFIEAYDQLSQQDLPFFISSDLILHTFQTVSSVAWQQTAAHYLAADLEALSKALVETSFAQWQEAVDAGPQAELLTEATRDNLAFFSVAARLLDPSFEAPSPVAGVVAEELTLMEQGAVFNSPLFQRSEDYGQYAPPPPYAGNDVMARYYRAMYWLARPLHIQNDDVQRQRQIALQSVQMVRGLEASQNFARWERIYQTAAYFQGAQPALSLLEVQAAAQAVYDQDLQMAELTQLSALDNFIATLQTLPAAGNPHPGLDEEFRPGQFSFMPDSHFPDEMILQEVTFNRVGVYGTVTGPLPPTALETDIGAIRALPRSLDVPSVLGSDLAWEQLQSSGETGYEGYGTQMVQLQAAYADPDSASWSGSHAAGLLYAAQLLLETPVQGGPFFMQSEAWERKQFNTWYGTWTNMRHDPILTPRPVRAVGAGGEAPFAYVEPQPALYARLAAQTRQMIDGLETRGLADSEAAQKLLQLERFLEGMSSISRKELAGERLTDDEMLLLTQTITRVADLTTFDPGEGETPLTDAALPRLVTVYRDASSGRLLQAGLGEAWPVYVLVPRDSQLVLAAGAVFSSYELLGEQLRPSDWQSMEERPSPPPWAQSYIVP